MNIDIETVKSLEVELVDESVAVVLQIDGVEVAYICVDGGFGVYEETLEKLGLELTIWKSSN